MTNVDKQKLIIDLEEKILKINDYIHINTKNSYKTCLFCNKNFYSNSNTERHIEKNCQIVKDLQYKRNQYQNELLELV
jgi:hypothetical protein